MSCIIDHQTNDQSLQLEKQIKNSLKQIFHACQTNQERKQIAFIYNIPGFQKNPNLSILLNLKLKTIGSLGFFTFDFFILKNGVPQIIQKPLRANLFSFLLNLNSKISLGEFLINPIDGRLKLRSFLIFELNSSFEAQLQKGELNYIRKIKKQNEIVFVTFNCVKLFVYHYGRIVEFTNRVQNTHKKIFNQNEQHRNVNPIYKKQILVIQSTIKFITKPYQLVIKTNFKQISKNIIQFQKNAQEIMKFYEQRQNLLKSKQLKTALQQNYPKQISQLAKQHIIQSTSSQLKKKKENKHISIQIFGTDETVKIHSNAKIQLKIIKGSIKKNNKNQRAYFVIKQSKNLKGLKKIKYEKVIINILAQLENNNYLPNYFLNQIKSYIKSPLIQSAGHQPQQFLISEFIKNGSLRVFMQNKREFLSIYSKLQLLIKIQKSLQQIHSSKIEHLDLKPENILLDKNLIPKIIDFGQSYCYNQNFSQEIQQVAECFSVGVSPPYSAPQLYNKPSKLNYFNKVNSNDYFKRDVFSFGVMMFEIIFEELPFDVSNQKKNQYKQLINFTPEKALKYAYKDVGFLILRLFWLCIDQDPKNRPGFQWIRVILKKIHWVCFQF